MHEVIKPIATRIIGLAICLGSTLAAPSLMAEECIELECLFCSALSDPASYPPGNMESMAQIVPGKDRWLFRSEIDLTNEFGIPAPMQPEFARLMAAFASKGTQVAMVLQPTRGLMHRDKLHPDHMMGFDYGKASASLRQFMRQLEQAGALVPDVMRLVEEPPEDYFFRRDHHWTPQGARVTARLVADDLMQQAVYQRLGRKAHRTEPGLTQVKDGTLNQALNRVCGNNYGFQYVQGYQTIPEGDDAQALFGEQPMPDVVLVGTSNSAVRNEENRQFNFDGFIKEFMSVDLLNYALPGAGAEGALIEYLHSESYTDEDPPELILWELPINYRLDDPWMYRQLIPAIEGQCTNEQALMSNRVEKNTLKEGERVELLSNSGAGRRDLRNQDGYLDLRISNRNLKQFYLIVYYDDGSRDKVWIRRSDIVSGGQYFLELSKAAEFRGANLLSVFLESSEALDSPATLEIRLCP